MTRDLTRLLRPASIAVIGGGDWCANVLEQCRASGYGGALWPVHPHRDRVAGLRAYPAVDALPSPPDAAFVGVNREASIEVVAALAALGCGGAVCFAAGFREAEAESRGAAELEKALVAAAGEMPILGPNCYGFVNYLDGAMLWPDQHGGRRVDTGVAIIAQSSNIAINLTMQRRGLPLAALVTVGNQAQTGLADVALALLDDPRITAIGFYIEGIGNLPAFQAMAAKAQALGKPLVALKPGASDTARQAAQSHTASLAGSEAGARALFNRLGIVRVTGLSALLEALKLLHIAGPLGAPRIAALSCSGGEAALMADAGQAEGLAFPPLTETQKARLSAVLGPRVRLANPLDYNTYIWKDRAAMAQVFTTMLDGDCALGIVVTDFPRADRCSPADWDCVIDAAQSARAQTGKPLALMASLAENMPESVAESLMAAGLIPLCGLEAGIEAIGAIARANRGQEAEPLLLPRAPERHAIWDESRAKARLAAHGLPVPKGADADSPEAAARLAAKLGFPVALKGLGLAHKSEAGAVVLNLSGPDAVAAAARAMPARRFRIERMVPDARAELLVGVTHDAAHGHLLTLGAGGVLTEIMRDTRTLLLPVSADDIREALTELRIAPLLKGYRGAPGVDESAIVRAVMAVQSFVLAEHGRVLEVEINPLLCLSDGAVAADALIVAEEDTDENTD